MNVAQLRAKQSPTPPQDASAGASCVIHRAQRGDAVLVVAERPLIARKAIDYLGNVLTIAARIGLLNTAVTPKSP